MNIFLINFLAFGAILSALLVITATNPVISIIYLISVFINVAGYLALHNITYLALVYIIVYVGAIAILFLFVIIILDVRLVELIESGSAFSQNLPIATILGFLFFFEVLSSLGNFNISEFYIFPLDFFISLTSSLNNTSVVNMSFTYIPDNVSNFLQIQSIAITLYTIGAFWLILSSIILLLSIIGAIVLSVHHSNIEEDYIN